MWGDTVLAVRDPLGIKPLCIGEIDSGFMVASESVAIDTLNGKLIRDVSPASWWFQEWESSRATRLARLPNPSHCVFEYIYFARPDSIMDGRLIYDVRVNIGAEPG